jgi:hypothetical protein
MAETYRLAFRAAFKSLNFPYPLDTGSPEYQQLRRDFPHDRPPWWAPPPGMFEAVKDYMAERARRVCEEPDWSRWTPSYQPGKPWPWRKPESDGDGATG